MRGLLLGDGCGVVKWARLLGMAEGMEVVWIPMSLVDLSSLSLVPFAADDGGPMQGERRHGATHLIPYYN